MQQHSFLLGSIPASLFLAMLVFASIGVIMALLIDSQKRDQCSKSTPAKFSFKFLLKDNWKTILLTVLAILMTLRFAAWIFAGQFAIEDLGSPLGQEKWLFGSLLVGFMYNTLLQNLKDKASKLNVKRDPEEVAEINKSDNA